MKNLVKLALGILTSVGGFLEVGSIATAAQAGAAFRFSLLWAILLGTVCIAFLVEMSGRLAAVSKHTLAGAVRERFGIRFHAVPLTAQIALDFLVLGAEIGGVCLALQFLSGVSFRLWALPVALVIWLLLWRGTFKLIENGVAALGLVTLAFVVGAFRLHPPLGTVAAGLLPSLPSHEGAKYGFLAVSILGATISPYLFSFYSSGAVEERWKETDLPVNRITAALGMGFGSIVSMSVLVVAALVLAPRGIDVQRYDQAVPMLTDPLGRAGFFLFVASLAVGSLGAALELSLDVSYIVAQALGWNWRKDQRAADDARFSLVYTVLIFLSSLLMVAGLDPLELTNFSMALTVMVLPLVTLPLLILMNDESYVGEHRNGWIGNLAVVAITALGFVLALVAIPLEIAGG
jgi:Mn2+/Fe2+ NRAMP family transporter